MDDTVEAQRENTTTIHITHFKLFTNIDISKLFTSTSSDNISSIVGLLKFRLGVPLKPSLQDRTLFRAFVKQMHKSSRTNTTSTVVNPYVLGIVCASQEQNHLLIQDIGFYHVPSYASFDACALSKGGPLTGCKVSILNLHPLVPPSRDLIYPNDTSADYAADHSMTEISKKQWLETYNQLIHLLE